MATILWSSKARRDVEDIWLWIAKASSPDMADTLLDRIEARIERLARHPQLGPVRQDIAENARMLVCERWLVLYFIDPQGDVRIVRVMDGAQDPDASRPDFNAPPHGSV